MYNDSIEILLLRHYGHDGPTPAALEQRLINSVRQDAMAQQQEGVGMRILKHPISRRRAVKLVAVGSGGELGHRAESWIRRTAEGVRSKASIAHGLKAIRLKLIRKVDGTRSHVLRAYAGGVAELVLECHAPLEKIRRAKLAVRHNRDGDCWKTHAWVCFRGSARQFSVGESGEKRLVSGDCGVDGATRHTW